MVNKKSKKPLGRPSKKNNLDLRMVEVLYSLGLTDSQVGKVFDVSEVTIHAWKKDQKFLEARRKGKEVPDKEVEVSLYKRATGYTYPDTDIRVISGRIIRTPITKHCPPDPTSMIFWLKNRKKEEWRDRQEVGLTEADGTPLTVKVLFTDK